MLIGVPLKKNQAFNEKELIFQLSQNIISLKDILIFYDKNAPLFGKNAYSVIFRKIRSLAKIEKVVDIY
jgi:hypothetical protein